MLGDEKTPNVFMDEKVLQKKRPVAGGHQRIPRKSHRGKERSAGDPGNLSEKIFFAAGCQERNYPEKGQN